MPKVETDLIDNVLTVRLGGIKTGWEKYIMLVSDQHHDSPNCNRKLEKSHLEKAKERDALIFMGGDTFDAMQGKYDPRANYDHLEPFLKKDNYFDAVVGYNAEFYRPYAKQIVMIGNGNHESSVLKHHNISLVDRLAGELNREDGAHVYVGGYGGWIRIMLKSSTRNMSINLKYFHGDGGESPVTKGVIQTARQAVYLPDADIVWNGHCHNQYILAQPRERLSGKGKLYKDTLWFIRTPGYVDDYGNGSGGWAVEKGLSPKPMGCIWLKLYYDSDKVRIIAEQDIY
jgi:predicted phosphodiesterase